MTARAVASPGRSRDGCASALATPIDLALERLAQQGSVAFPTETSWGLAADATSEAAIEGVRRWKGRDEGKPISLLVTGETSLPENGFEVTPLAQELIRRFWPGPLTLVLRCRRSFARGIASPGGAVGVRRSSHPVAAELARAAGQAGIGLLTATSLNRAGESPAITAREADALCCSAGRDTPLRLACGGDDAGGELPSTVIDLTSEIPSVSRWGALDAERLSACPGLEWLDTGGAR